MATRIRYWVPQIQQVLLVSMRFAQQLVAIQECDVTWVNFPLHVNT